MNQAFKPRVIAKTADYTINPARPDMPGTIFTNRGATANMTFTLPAPSLPMTGWHYEFIGMVNFNMVVSAGAGKALTFNNAAAASLAASTAGQRIGAVIRAFCDGVSWSLQGVTVGVTYTVA